MPLSLKRRGNYWWIYGSHEGVKVRETTGHTAKRKAELVLGRRQRELADPTHFRANQATVRTAAARWFREIRATMKPPTVHFYKCKAAHVVRLLGDVKLSRLTHERCLDFLETRREEGAHQHTYSRELVALRLILKSAKRAGEFSGDPRDTVPRISSGYVPVDAWVEPHVVWAAIAELPEERGAALAFMAATACDFSNLALARPEDILDDRVYVRGTKTSTRARWLPRVGVFDTFLRHAVAYARKGQPTLFEPWRDMHREVRAACRRAGVQEFTARTIRRSCATWMARARVPFPVAMKFMGHASMTMLLKVYAKYDVESIGEQMAERMT
jgi:integrase